MSHKLAMSTNAYIVEWKATKKESIKTEWEGKLLMPWNLFTKNIYKVLYCD